MANQMHHILVTDRVHPHLLQSFSKLYWEVDYKPELSYEEVKEILPTYTGIIINSKIKATKEFLDLTDSLQFIGRLGSGLEIIDLDYAKQRGVKVYSAPEGNCNAVAEHALGMLLSLFNNLHQANSQVKHFEWLREQNRGIELYGKTVGIVGFGHTGSSFAKVLAGFDVTVLAYDKYKTDYTTGFDYVQEATPEQIRQESDIISFHLPLTPETKYLADQEYLMACKDGVYIMNTSRGQVLNLEDLLFALSIKKVAGACLDVFENEKFDTLKLDQKVVLTKLLQLDNVLVSPHVAGWTHESLFKIADTLVRKITADF
jgi:D-3-phosphoglycerate dehydrogenase